MVHQWMIENQKLPHFRLRLHHFLALVKDLLAH